MLQRQHPSHTAVPPLAVDGEDVFYPLLHAPRPVLDGEEDGHSVLLGFSVAVREHPIVPTGANLVLLLPNLIPVREVLLVDEVIIPDKGGGPRKLPVRVPSPRTVRVRRTDAATCVWSSPVKGLTRHSVDVPLLHQVWFIVVRRRRLPVGQTLGRAQDRLLRVRSQRAAVGVEERSCFLRRRHQLVVQRLRLRIGRGIAPAER
mmetsp:Transcript_16386/g.40463  ORF Transcript_16386/g.40463 Transcript_16386/m.40463 type:complete len:203 (+) Transcript_16386:789-1397(+)